MLLRFARPHDSPSLIQLTLNAPIGEVASFVNVSRKDQVRNFLRWFSANSSPEDFAKMRRCVLIAYGVEMREKEGVVRRQFDAWQQHLEANGVGYVAGAPANWADGIIGDKERIIEEYTFLNDENCLRASLFDVDQFVHRHMMKWVQMEFIKPNEVHPLGIISRELKCWSCPLVCKREHYFHVEIVVSPTLETNYDYTFGEQAQHKSRDVVINITQNLSHLTPVLSSLILILNNKTKKSQRPQVLCSVGFYFF